MTLSNIDQIFLYLAWIIAAIELIVGLYVLVFNHRHYANRHVGLMLILFALSNYEIGNMIKATSVSQATWPAIILSMTTPAAIPALLAVAIVLLTDNRPSNRVRWLLWVAYGLVILPFILVLVDLARATNLLYTGIDPKTYTGGFLFLYDYAKGSMAGFVQTISYALMAPTLLLTLLYFAVSKKENTRDKRVVLWLLLAAGVALGVEFYGSNFLPQAGRIIIANGVFSLVFAIAGFRQMLSDRRLQQSSLQTRLILLLLAIAIPVLVAVSVFVTSRAQTQIESDVLEALRSTNQGLSSSVTLWNDYNLRALQTLVTQPDIISMDPDRQKPALEGMSEIYPYMYLVSTVSMQGQNVARNDKNELADYSDRYWYHEARRGVKVVYQTLVGRTTGQPALIVSMPIREPNGKIVGVGMFASDLDLVANRVQTSKIGEQGYSYVVDSSNQVIAHPDRAYSAELRELSSYPPVAALRQGTIGLYRFTDDQGTNWVSNLNLLSNDWGVIVQIPEQDMLAPVRDFQRLAITTTIIGSFLLLILSWLTLRQGLQPIRSLTDTAIAIAGGDYNRQAPIESNDEIGVLATSFNSMTEQLRGLINELEDRVAVRTKELERQTVQLQVAAEVASEAAAILDPENLLEYAVHLISERFNFYHAGIFLVDNNNEYALLRAASSEGGQRMLVRKHKLKVGEVGIVGYVAATAEPRIALDVGTDATFFNNPDLPDTRSEMGLPLKVHGRVIGVLDVQSTQAAAFTQEDVEILQILADQLALAIENARLITGSQQALNELEKLYSQQMQQAWENQLLERPIALTYDNINVKAEDFHEAPTGDVFTMTAPIVLRGQPLGSISFYRDSDAGPWTQDEAEMVEETLSHVVLALENARLLEEVRRSVRQEQTVSQIMVKAQSSLDLETVMKTTLEEISRVLTVSKARIRLRADKPANGGEPS